MAKRIRAWVVALLCLYLPCAAFSSAGAEETGKLDTLTSKAMTNGSVRVVVGFEKPVETGTPTMKHSPGWAKARRRAVGLGRSKIISKLPPGSYKRARAMNYLPYIAMEVNAEALGQLQKMDRVTSLSPDVLYSPSLADSSPLIGADLAWDAGYTGSGEVIAIIDSGVDQLHPFLSGKVISEACYSTTYGPHGSVAVCSSGSVAPGAGMPCSVNGCYHGTHVAGIAAGNGDGAGVAFSGVAKEADLVAIQVFSQFNSPSVCGASPVPCILSYNSDMLAGLDRAYELKVSEGLNIVSVNMSLGGSNYSDQSACDVAHVPMTDAIALLREVNVATVVASGNDGDIAAINHPACISSAISVGATDKTDGIASYSNSVGFLSLLAPGSSIYSSIPDAGYSYLWGTSMATPQVAGAWALMKDKTPDASVSDVLAALQGTGQPITDPRNGNTTPRIQIDQALSIAANPGNLSITFSADNGAELYVNGLLVGDSSNWKTAVQYTVPLQAGPNVVAFKGIDAGGVAGLLADLSWNGGAASTDISWKVSPAYSPGWANLGYDDSGWPSATPYGEYGVEPWLTRVAGFSVSTPAQWIWTADNADDDVAYLRYSFTQGEAELEVSTVDLPDAAVGQDYSQPLLASGGSVPYLWSVVDGSLPVGLLLDSGTGVVSGVSSTEETAEFTVQVLDSAGGEATRELSLSVGPAPDVELKLLVSADNSSEVYVNGIPLGTTGNWQVAGSFTTPLQPGLNVVAIKGEDAGGAAGLLAELTWNGFTVNSDTAWAVSAVAEAGWETVGFDDSGWESATSYGLYGVSPWLDRVEGFSSGSGAHWVWTGDNLNDDVAYLRYSFMLGTAPLMIEPGTLVEGLVGQHYEQALVASGGFPPYSWSLVAGDLPEGLELDESTGVIFGKPLLEETGVFTIQVTDAVGSVGTADYSIVIGSAPSSEITLTLSADNLSDVYINGELVGYTGDWKVAGIFTAPLKSGLNVIAVKGVDLGGVAGILAELSWGETVVETSPVWKVSLAVEPGWETVAYDDDAWEAATSFGVYGVAPWLTRVDGFNGSSTAHWIWSADNFGDDNAYLRYTFTVP